MIIKHKLEISVLLKRIATMCEMLTSLDKGEKIISPKTAQIGHNPCMRSHGYVQGKKTKIISGWMRPSLLGAL